jgi:hypothetical protein
MQAQEYEVQTIVARALNSLHIRVDVNPDYAASCDDKFTLYGSNNQSNYQSFSYKQVKTIRDDLISGDDYIDIVFTNLLEDLFYWLEINPGMGGTPYFLFEAFPYDDLNTQIE